MVQDRQIVGINLPPEATQASKFETKRHRISLSEPADELCARRGPLRGNKAMVAITNERELALVAYAIIGDRSITAAERQLIGGRSFQDRDLVQACRELIAAGDDPLGEAFLSIRSPETRRKLGAIYTPDAIVEAMIGWASRRGTPVRVVDPGAGSGRFIAAAALAFPMAALVACDIDPLAILILRANAVVLGFEDRLSIELIDYRLLELEPVEGPTLYVGNPPYVRHHGISREAKTWFAATAVRLGFKASKLAGLHVHFFLRTREIARPGDYGAFVTSAEWMDVNYGSVLRQMLADGLGGSSLQVFSPRGMPFADAMTTGAITTFIVGKRPKDFTVREVESPEELGDLDVGRRVSWDEVQRQSRWSQMVRPPTKPLDGMVSLGDLFRVHRGVVTGKNAVFIEGAYPRALPAEFLAPAVTRAKDLINAGPRLTAEYARRLRRLVVLPRKLSDLVARQEIDQFKQWAESQGADQSWTAKQRSVWWSIVPRAPAPILCTYMGRRPPVFVRNDAGVVHINIAHGLYPRVPMKAADLDAYSAWLSSNVCISEGRTYAGGLTKFEPREIERILVPCLKSIHGDTGTLDREAAPRRCGSRESALSARAIG